MNRKEIPKYTGYTDEQIEAIQLVSQEIGRIEERQEKLSEEMFNLKMQMWHAELREVIDRNGRK